MSQPGFGASQLSRRGFLAASGLGAAALTGLAGCNYQEQGADVGKFNIPDPKKSLPSKDVKFRLADSNDTKSPFWKAFFKAYEKKHQNIQVTYDGMLVNRLDEVIPLGIRNGTAHDVFQLPPSITIQKAVGEGWVAPLDDLIPDFDNWMKKFPEGTFAEGQQIFDGKLYLVPLATEQRHFCILHYNKKLMDDAGYDPSSKPLTVDEYRDAARKITKKGDGQVYGVVLEINQPNRLVPWVDYMTRMAGKANIGGVNPENGEYYFSEPEVLEAIEVVLALNKDGSLFPGSNSLSAPEAWPRVIRGAAGMVSAGPWVTVAWESEDPNFEFGVADHPALIDNPYPLGYPAFGADSVSVFSGSKVKNVAGDVLSYVLSDEGQVRWGEIVKVGNPPIFEKARKESAKTYKGTSKDCLELAESMVVNPEPIVVNPDIALVSQEMKTPVVEDWGAVLQKIFVGEEKNPKKALAELVDRRERVLDQAIADARKKGAKVSREDWVFSNWKPREDYLPEDYEGR